MPLVIPPGFGLAAVELSGSAGTPTHVTTMGINLGDAGGDFVLAANAVMQAYIRAFRTVTANALTISRVTLSVGNDGPSGSVESNLPPVVGGQAGNFESVAMAPIARKITNRLGRSGRGRMFLPGVLSTTDVDINGSVSSAKRTALNTACSVFMANLELGDPDATPPEIDTPPCPPVLLHSVAPTTPTPLTELVVQPTVGWIRGRIR